MASSPFVLLPFVEIEVRLGTQTDKKFDSSVDKRYFEKIQTQLSTGEWKSVEFCDTVEYIKDSIKVISPSNKVIMKENVLNRTYVLKNSPFDVRFSVNQEFKLDSFLTNTTKSDSFIRTKKRTSYVSDTFRYDLTTVNENKNNINVLKYEIEIELLINETTLCWSDQYISDFLECKIYDLINIVEPLDRDTFKLKLN